MDGKPYASALRVAVKNILKYFKRTKDAMLTFGGVQESKVKVEHICSRSAMASSISDHYGKQSTLNSKCHQLQ
ncbi:hypothetical protein Tco_0086159 [Tanacetum coccineum]